MDELFLPWWTVLLLGMWAAALTLWMHPSVHREIRFWAGVSTLVYLVLIFLALGGGHAAAGSATTDSSRFRLFNLVLAFGIAISLLASVWSLGRVSLPCKQICYVVLTFADAGICALFQQFEVSIGLLIVSGLTARSLIRKWSRQETVSWHERLAEFVKFANIPVPPERRGEFALIGGLAGLMAFALLGTISFSLHIETTRSTSNQRQSALPSRDQIERVLGKPPFGKNAASVIDLAFGARSDLVVLMAIAVFLALAISLTEGDEATSDPAISTSIPSASLGEMP